MQAIRELEASGYEVSVDGDEIVCRKRLGATPDPFKVRPLFQELKNRKPEALSYLKKQFVFDRHLQDAIERLNKAGIDMNLVLPANRKRSLALELEITVAANTGDVERFTKLVREWTRILMSKSRARTEAEELQ